MSKSLEIIDLGRIDYVQAWKIQEAKLNEMILKRNGNISDHDSNNNLFLCEHNPVFTLGKSGNENNLLIHNEILKKKGISFVKTNRGGDITYHGPGQLIAYPLLDLNAIGIGVKKYVFLLEEVIISLLKNFNIDGNRLDKAAGIWLDTSSPAIRKIGAIGVKVSRQITMHGIAFNVNTDLDYFNYINPCGFTNKGVTSLEKELGNKQDMNEMKELYKKHFCKVFNLS